ncbi:kinase-like domain [Cordyceps militaris]|uniref:Kinase-like domain n=1 Tax=Cordyceps militaris TaxID=73501 RepID=A0A2H4SF73_CORMI|nr:kinase-like domain [Cordyceps militaris]
MREQWPFGGLSWAIAEANQQRTVGPSWGRIIPRMRVWFGSIRVDNWQLNVSKGRICRRPIRGRGVLQGSGSRGGMRGPERALTAGRCEATGELLRTREMGERMGMQCRLCVGDLPARGWKKEEERRDKIDEACRAFAVEVEDEGEWWRPRASFLGGMQSGPDVLGGEAFKGLTGLTGLTVGVLGGLKGVSEGFGGFRVALGGGLLAVTIATTAGKGNDFTISLTYRDLKDGWASGQQWAFPPTDTSRILLLNSYLLTDSFLHTLAAASTLHHGFIKHIHSHAIILALVYAMLPFLDC